MILTDILKRKGNRVIHISPGTSIGDAAKVMVENKIGAVLITDDEQRPIGIFTERDNLRVVADKTIDLSSVIVDDCMTRDVIVGMLTDSVEEAMALMTEQRVRHLPIVSEGLLVGLVSIGDVVKAVATKYDREIQYLHNFIQQGY